MGKGDKRRQGADNNKFDAGMKKVKKVKDFTPPGEPKKGRKGGLQFGPY